MKLQKFIDKFETIAPAGFALKGDKVGLQIGAPLKEVKNIFLTLDVTKDAVQKAKKKKCRLVLSHHPLIYEPLSEIEPESWKGKLVKELLSNNIALYAAHTNLDAAPGGVTDTLCEVLGLKETEPLYVSGYIKLCKLAVFVPQTHLEKVRIALCGAGAGHIGNYSDCTFLTSGIGTFKPQKGTRPFIGSHGKVERVGEARLETIVPEYILPLVLEAMKKVHPYEEIAYDVYPLKNKTLPLALSKVGKLQGPMKLPAFASFIEKTLKTKIRYMTPLPKKTVKKIAVHNGSGGSSVKFCYGKDIDLLLVGEMKYHDRLEAEEMGLAVIEAGHKETEEVIIKPLKTRLEDLLGKEVRIFV